LNNQETEMLNEFKERMGNVAKRYQFLNMLRDNVYTNYEVFQTIFFSIWGTRVEQTADRVFMPMSLMIEAFGKQNSLVAFSFENHEGFMTCFIIDGEDNKTKLDNMSGMVLVQIVMSLLTIYREEDIEAVDKMITSNINARFNDIAKEQAKHHHHHHEHGENCSCGK
jgi:hypothetical protein